MVQQHRGLSAAVLGGAGGVRRRRRRRHERSANNWRRAKACCRMPCARRRNGRRSRRTGRASPKSASSSNSLPTLPPTRTDRADAGLRHRSGGSLPPDAGSADRLLLPHGYGPCPSAGAAGNARSHARCGDRRTGGTDTRPGADQYAERRAGRDRRRPRTVRPQSRQDPARERRCRRNLDESAKS